jgi:hypothetical protein
LSIKLKDSVISAASDSSLTSPLIKLSKYLDQIILYILRLSPPDIMDEHFSQEVTEFLMAKLQGLLTVHSGGCIKGAAALVEKSNPLPT